MEYPNENLLGAVGIAKLLWKYPIPLFANVQVS